MVITTSKLKWHVLDMNVEADSRLFWKLCNLGNRFRDTRPELIARSTPMPLTTRREFGV